MKAIFRSLGQGLIKVFGSVIRDEHDGSTLGRALLFSWRGRVYVIGYEGPPLRLVFRAPDGIAYWKSSIGFTRAEIPDFPREIP